MRNIHQQVAAAEAKLARLRLSSRKLETRRKIILGAFIAAEAARNGGFANWLLKQLRQGLRPADLEALASWIETLEGGTGVSR